MSILEFIVEMKWILFLSILCIWGTIVTKKTVKGTSKKVDEFMDKAADKAADAMIGKDDVK